MDMHHPSASRYDDESDDELNEHWREPGDPDGVVAAELKLRQGLGHPKPPHSPVVRYHIKDWHMPRVPWKTVLGVALVLATIGVAYWMGFQRAVHPPKKQTAQSQVHGQTAETVVAPATHYDSTAYGIGVDYPNNWVVSDTPQKLTITSPNYTLTGLNEQTTGHVIVSVQNQQASVPGFPAGGATASLDSDKLTYKQPTSVQRAQTYVSYLGYNSPSGIDALYLTGDNGYPKGQFVPMSDVVKGNPLIGVTFAKCSTSYCTKGTPAPVTLQAASWQNSKIKPVILNILQSITVSP